jgi:YVTN family beta-propeller protein
MLRAFSFTVSTTALTIALLNGSTVCGESVLNSVAPPAVIFELLALNRDLPTAAQPKYLSLVDLVASPDSTTLYVAEQTAKQIAVINLQTNTVTKVVKLPNEVTGLAAASVGSKIYATCSSDLWPAGMVCEVDVSCSKVVNRIAVGHGARSPVLNPDNTALYVCNLYDNDVSVIDLSSGRECGRIPVVRAPYSAAITPDGSVLVVVNSIPAEASTDTANVSCRISLINTATRKADTVALPRGSHSALGVTVSPDGNYAFITHLIGMFTLPATQIDNGWIQSNHCAVIDIKRRKLLNEIPLDKATKGSANPWGVSCTRDANILCIAHSGSNELSLIDFPRMMAKAIGDTDLTRYFGSMNNIMQKVPVKGKAPRALAIVGNKLYTAGYFEDDIEIFDFSPSPGLELPPGATASGIIAIGPSQSLASRRKGEYHFYDATACWHTWQSCHSCHPFSRPDALNWILSVDNCAPKNTKSILFSWWTPPTSWVGKQVDARDNIRIAIQRQLFKQVIDITGIEDTSIVYIDTFFMNMKPVPSPHLSKGRLSPSAERGRAIFKDTTKVNCGICHTGPLCTDNNFHNTGVPDPWDNNRDWNTPSLIEVWRTAPYSHLGSFDKIEDILKLRTHSNAGNLSDNDFRDLMEYVLSL